MSPNSPFDLYLKGNKEALSETAIKGMQAFNKSGCLACHFGVNFAGPAPGPAMGMGDGFYELFPTKRGTVYEKQLDLLSDLGRFEFTKQDYEKHMWRVPPLRNIALSAPYFHNGSAATLEQAIKAMGKAQFGFDLSDEEIRQIAAFLTSLTGEMPEILRSK
jgi:cytochrome c peroxidase